MKLQIEDCLVNSSFPIITNSLLQEPALQFEPLQLTQILDQRNLVTHNLINSRMNLLKERRNDVIQHGPPMGSIKVLKCLMSKRNEKVIIGPLYHCWVDPNKGRAPPWSPKEEFLNNFHFQPEVKVQEHVLAQNKTHKALVAKAYQNGTRKTQLPSQNMIQVNTLYLEGDQVQLGSNRCHSHLPFSRH